MMTISKGNPLRAGVTKADKKYNFAIASTKEKIILKLYDGRMVFKEKVVLDETYKCGDVFSCSIEGVNLDKAFYSYEDENGEFIADACAKTLSGCEHFGKKKTGKHLSRVCLDTYDWENDRPLNYEYSECIFYKLHVRGYTKDRSSGVKKKGTFAGIIEKLPYMKELGITTVELMPAYEFDETGDFINEETSVYKSPAVKMPLNYWGYCNGFHYAPKAAFSSVASKKSDYTTEFKDMVKLLHRNKLEVVMEMYFDNETPDYITECIKYWVNEYHIDGVHLYGPEDALRTVASCAMLSKTKIITVYWDGTRGTYKNKANSNSGFADTVRKFLKGDDNQLGDFVHASKTNPDNSANINYVTSHNGFTMYDLVSYDRKHNENNNEGNRDGEDYNYSWNCGWEGNTGRRKVLNLRKKQIKNAFTMLIMAAGTPMLVAGDEFMNSQNGNNNPYCHDDEISWLNWKNTAAANEIKDYVRMLIEFRKKYKILHSDRELVAADILSCGFPDISYHGSDAWYHVIQNYNRHIGIMYCTKYGENYGMNPLKAGETYKLIYVAYNMHWEERMLALPKLPVDADWRTVMQSEADREAVVIDNKQVKLPPRTSAIFICEVREKKVNKKSKKGKVQ